MTARIGWAAPGDSGGSDEGGTTGGSSVITLYEIRRCEGWRFGDAKGGDLMQRRVEIRRFEEWGFDVVNGENLTMRETPEPCKECVIGGSRKNFFKLTVAFCEFLLSLTNYEAEFF